ncbi:MAG TPA: DUF1501 domain-containing protein [Gemmataceae bacterium]|nr:DUF1501 domain-containing protein [Gemmataceae bacterium]
MFGKTDRRHFMAHAAAGAAVTVPGLSFLTQLRAQAPAMKKKQKSLIILWMGGGPATIDIWDMKPGSPNGGEHKPKPTAASGVEISEHLPNVAKQFKNLSIIRSLSTREGDHARGTFLMNAGRSPSPLLDYPSLGSVLSYYQAMDVENMKNADLPAFISVAGGPAASPGFLGMKYAPFQVQNPGAPPENVSPPAGISEAQMARRAAIFQRLEGGFNTNVQMDAARAHKEVYEKALNLVVSQRKEVFNLEKEIDGKPIDPKLKEEYGAAGQGATSFGRGCLLARKLVEAGCACVEVSLGGWDNHQNIFPTLARRLPNELDRGMGTLVKDLAQRGKLQDTVIVWMGDFGRTPKINQNAGRDHYPRAWSVVVGGGGIKGGIAYGETDKDGTEATDKKVDILDLYATIYKALGIDPTPETNASVRDNLGRPYYIAGDKPNWIKDLVG